MRKQTRMKWVVLNELCLMHSDWKVFLRQQAELSWTETGIYKFFGGNFYWNLLTVEYIMIIVFFYHKKVYRIEKLYHTSFLIQFYFFGLNTVRCWKLSSYMRGKVLSEIKSLFSNWKHSIGNTLDNNKISFSQ